MNLKIIFQKIFRNYREVVIFSIGFGIGLLFSIWLWYIIVLVIGFLSGYTFSKTITKKNGSEKK